MQHDDNNGSVQHDPCDGSDAATSFDEGDAPSFTQNPTIWRYASFTPQERKAYRERAKATKARDAEDAEVEAPLMRFASGLRSLDRFRSAMSQEAWDRHMGEVVHFVDHHHPIDLGMVVESLKARQAKRRGDFTSDAACEADLDRREERLWCALAMVQGDDLDDDADPAEALQRLLAGEDNPADKA